MDEPFWQKFQRFFSTLGTDVFLLNDSGQSLFLSENPPESLPSGLDLGAPVVSGGFLFQKLSTTPTLFLAVRVGTEADRLIRLSASLLEALMTGPSPSDSFDDAYREMLLHELQPTETEALASRFGLKLHQRRCVILLHLIPARGRSPYSMLQQSVPLTGDDVLVPLDSHWIALVKDMADMADTGELREYASALRETILEEEGLQVMVGIGEPSPSLHDLSLSCHQARKALELGCVFRETEHIHVYRTMLLERLLADIPPETASHYHGLLFNRRTAHLFNEETLKTVNMFLAKDLNLSDTARHLYIHRNTLVYRLDKIHRLSGLDLRRFEDAVTFKLLHDLKKCSKTKRRKIS